MIEKMVNVLFNRAHEAIDLELAGVLRRRDILAGAVAAAAMKSLSLAAATSHFTDLTYTLTGWADGVSLAFAGLDGTDLSFSSLTWTAQQYGRLRWPRVAAVAVVTAALLMMTPASVAHACSCWHMTDTQRFTTADVVFVGTPVARSEPPASDEGMAEAGRGLVTWTLAVEGIAKGTVNNPQPVRSAPDEGGCGVEFELGRRYQVFAMHNGSSLVTGLCAGTQQLTGAPAIGPLLAALLVYGWQTDQVPFLGALGLILVILSGLGVSRRRLLALANSRD